MISANLRLMLSLRFSGKNAGVAQKTSENKPDPRTGQAREGVRHPKHRLWRDGERGVLTCWPGDLFDRRRGPFRLRHRHAPRIAALHAEGEIDYLRERISDVITFVGHVGLYVTLHLMVWSRVLILVWLGSAYSGAIPLLRVLLLAVIPYSAFVRLRPIINGIEHRPVNTVNLGLSLLGVGLASQATLMSGWGMMGLALSTSLGFWLLAVLSVRYLWGRFGLVGHHLMPIKLASANAGLLLPSLGAAWLLQSHLGGWPFWGAGP